MVYLNTWWWGWWEPWANTLFYYKFDDSLLNEATWTVDASFYGSWWYVTMWDGKSADLSNAAVAVSTKLPDIFTLSFYWYYNSFPWFNWIYGTSSTGSSWIHIQIEGSDKINIYNYWTMQWTTINIWTLNTNQWYYFTLVRDSWVITVYINWQSKGTITTGWNNSTTLQYYLWYSYNTTRYAHWYIDNAIMESVARSQQDITNYFNQTKWDYWL